MSSLSSPRVLHQASPLPFAARWAPNDLSVAVLDTEAEHDERVSTEGTPSEVEIAERTHLEAEERAREEQERLVREAYASGYEEGRLDGEIAEGVRLRNAIAAAEKALDEIRENEAAWQSCVQENIVALSIAVARHIVGRELHTDPETVAELVRRALTEFPIDQPVRIRVNPHDLSLISTFTTPDGSPLPIAPNRDVRWHADARLHPGGCIVEGRERIIDGRIDTALERLYRRLTYTND
jgi:flagellar assembly protein FliH